MPALTLRGKFGLLLAAFVVAMGAVTVLNFATSRRVGADVELVESRAYPQLTNAIRAQARFAEMARLIEDAAVTGEPSLLERAGQARTTFANFVDVLLADAGPSSRPTVLRVRSDFIRYYADATGLATYLLSEADLDSEMTGEIEQRGQGVFALRQSIEADLDSLVAHYERQMTSALGEAAARVRRQSKQALAISVAASIGLLLLLLYVGRRITRPIRALVALTGEVGQGDFDRPMDIPSLGTDEVAVLAASFERMVRELRTTTVSRSFLDSIIASMGDSLIVTGPDGAIETVNQATCAMLGYDAPELVGASMRDVAPDADTALFGGSGSDGSPAEVRALETAYRSASGQIVPVSLSSSPIRRGAGTTQGVVCVAQDITERRNLERMKDEFIATLSHELRTPLTAVVSTLDMLAMGLLGEMSDKACELIEVGRRNGERLVALIDDVLDLSRIESGTLTDDVRRHELTEIVAEAVEANQAYAGQFGVTLTVAGGAHRAIVSVDRGRFIQVLSNLLSNAAKYSHRGGSVRVIVARHDGRARVSVVDEGAGIPADALDRVFDRFFRVDSSTTRERGGVGLGLSISKAIVERLGGDIGLNSQLGHGTTFWVDLPAHGDPDDSPEPRG